MSAQFFTDQALFQAVFEELGKFLPLRCVALCGADNYEFLAAMRGDDDEVRIILADTLGEIAKVERAPGRHELLGVVLEAMANHTNLGVRDFATFDYPQTFWGRTVGTVVFFADKGTEPDEHLTAFLSMCAHFIAYERQESRLFLHATKQASLGNIAFELSKSLIQGLTAIGTIVDYIVETEATPEVVEGLHIIRRNVGSMQRQVQDFRRLSSLRRDAVETVHLDNLIEQALDMLTMTIESRKIRVVKDYQTELDCVLLNGSTLARTFLDLISSAVRTAEASGQVVLRLTDTDNGFISLEISHDGQYANVFDVARAAQEQTVPELIEGTPSFMLAQRTIQSCGGRLLFEQEKGARCGFRLLLPRNATSPARVPDTARRS
jgi:signal transduction histidine kinase